MAVIEALKYSRANLSDNVWSVLGYLSDSFSSARFVDPANTNNIVSDDLTKAEKGKISSQASISRAQKNWEDIVW
jgi:hypothetical protein